MLAKITHNKETFTVNLLEPIDISVPITSKSNPQAWYLDKPQFTTVKNGDWVGSVKDGGDVNFRTITFNPHSHGTHTETVGHITSQIHSINKHLKTFFFIVEVVTVIPEKLETPDNDFVIKASQFDSVLNDSSAQALIIRTLPNLEDKKTKNWSHTNWPYVEEEAMVRFRESGIKHLLIDLPSVDKEKDGGALKAHHAFWNTKGALRLDATITEMIYVPDTVPDGTYLLNLQIASFDNDATPSKPILYSIKQ